MESVVFIIIVIGCILCHIFSKYYNEQVEEKYGQGCINWWLSVITAVLLAATLLTIGENNFWRFLFLTIFSAGISVWLVYKKMIGWGATLKEVLLGSFTQVASAIGVAAAILFVIFLLFGDSRKKRRRR